MPFLFFPPVPCFSYLLLLSLNCVLALSRYASEGPLKGILGYTDEDVVSNDFVGDSRCQHAVLYSVLLDIVSLE